MRFTPLLSRSPAQTPARGGGALYRRNSMLLALALVAVSGCRDTGNPAGPASAAGADPRALTAPAKCGQMLPGEGLRPDQWVRSCNGEAMLVLQTDGNVVEYDGAGALWVAPNTLGRGTSIFQMQHDGNLVAYNAALQPLWASNTAGNPNAWLAIQDDCALVIYRGPYPYGNGILWEMPRRCRPPAVSPVVGPYSLQCSWATFPTWDFCQHKTGSHRAGGGVAGADDTYAWDGNQADGADAGKPVYATAPGRVVNYGGSVAPGGGSGAVLIEHNSGGRIWWSGYLHLTGIQVAVNQSVTAGTHIGYIGSVGATTPHLHYVMYNGSNTYGGLRSYNGQFTTRH